jgi:hypothetical protein
MEKLKSLAVELWTKYPDKVILFAVSFAFGLLLGALLF